ncbi:MAG: hypothetical protein M3156_07085 [Thermoproteota archaeon]|nr:hypothetical protein [Thermoproteota archaeon]
MSKSNGTEIEEEKEILEVVLSSSSFAGYPKRIMMRWYRWRSNLLTFRKHGALHYDT